MGSLKRDETIRKIEAIADRVAQPAGIEIVEVELKGSGRNQLLRIYIDKPEGVTHSDCELVSRGVSAVLDVEDPIAGAYELEVSSPGLERKLGRWPDWQRFSGKKVKVVLKEPVPVATGDVSKVEAGEVKFFEGTIARAEEHMVTVQLADQSQITFPFEQVDRANLKFDW